MPRPAADAARLGRCALLLLVGVLVAEPARAQADARVGAPVAVSADLRGRFESDVDSRRDDGTLRPDRHRARVRFRLEARATPLRSIILLGRVRTGSPRSQQSPHLTIADFSGGSADRFTVVADRFLVQHAAGPVESWIGRNEFPFWAPSEFFWDRDVTLPGAFVSYRAPLRRASLQLRAGYFGLPDGAVRIGGRMAAGQVFADARLSGDWSLQAAVGLFDMQGAARTRHLLTGNGQRDYRIGAGSVQLARALPDGPARMVRVGADLLFNFRPYPPGADAHASAFRNGRTGVVLTTVVSGGRRSADAGAWEVSHTFARIETLAVNGSYAQDDWVRWGTATQTDASNLQGHEASGRYWLSRNLDCQARAFFVRSITTRQDGTRVRVDVNWRVALIR